MAPFETVAELDLDLERTRVYELGWQSWSPTGLHPAAATSPRPPDAERQTMGWRPGKPPPERGFQGEGVLAVVPPEGPVRIWAAPEPRREVPSIRAAAERGRLVVSADGPVAERRGETLLAALAAWADEVGPGDVAQAPPGWCSWYCYWKGVTEAAVAAELGAFDRLALDIRIVQIDDGWELELGDWEAAPRFGRLDRIAEQIRASGRRAGIWVAPFLVGARSRLAAEHPDWLVAVASGGSIEGQVLHVLDVTHPQAAEHLEGVFRRLAGLGFDYLKADFLYAGALDGRRHADASPLDAYLEGLRLIRAGIGEDALLLGCGAPLLPSIGLVDAMRVSPDVDPQLANADASAPGGENALAVGRARSWMHGRLWANDPDCLLARPEVEGRERWVAHVEACGGLVIASDRTVDLDERGLELTRRALRPSSPGPVDWDPFAG